MTREVKNEKALEKMMQKLEVDSSSKVADPKNGTKIVPPKDGTPCDATSCISSTGDATSSSAKGSDVDQESVIIEQGMYYPPNNYYGYYYPGYEDSFGEWSDQGYVSGVGGLDVQYPSIPMENGSFLYYVPGYGYFQTPLTPYAPSMVGVDGEFVAQQYFASPMPSQMSSPGYLPPPVPYGSEVMPAYSWDASPFIGEGAQINITSRVPVPPGPKSSLSTPNQPPLAPHAKPAQSFKSNTPLEAKNTLPSLDLPKGQVGKPVVNVQNQFVKPVTKVSQAGVGFEPTAVPAKGYIPITEFPAFSNQNKGGLYNSSRLVGLGANKGGLAWSEKLKMRNKMVGVGDFDPLNEQNKGPRTNNSRNLWVSDADTTGCIGSEINGKVHNISVIKRDRYNLPDFPIKYDDALFFVIKSYSEDDIHKSIKYSVWASTPNGNKRLDNAYQNAQERETTPPTVHQMPILQCHYQLLTEVNASGQFCGVAEMAGKVDFNKNMYFWQQDKWNGFFPVKWHIIKDVPNPQFRHIILENNDNKSVTNSRDTQEVKYPQGTEMLRIFKNYSSKTSILDDFDFYESRQKAMLEKRVQSPALFESSLQRPDETVPTVVKVDVPKPAVARQLMGSSASTKNTDGRQEDAAETKV